MLRAILLFALPVICTLWPRSSEACSCRPESDVVHPAGDTIPAHDGLIGRVVAVNTPTISVSYTDDPASAPIPGAFEPIFSGDANLWTFVPSSPLTIGRTIRVVVHHRGGAVRTFSRDLLVSSSTIAPSPGFSGVTGMQAIVSRFQNQAGGSCGPASEQSRVVFEGLPPPTPRAPLYRYFLYRQGEPPPAHPTTHGVAGHFVSAVRCGNPSARCEPNVPASFQVGQVWCARVEAVDLAGGRWGYDAEACATVVAEDMELIDFGGGTVNCRPVASAPDAGPVAADSGPTAAMDAGVADASTPDAAAPGDTADGSDGCACVRPPERGGHAGVASALLVACALLWRRRARL